MIPISAKEPYDFLSSVNADYNYALSIAAQGIVTEEVYKNQVIHLADDNTEERITLSSGSIFYVSWDWKQLSESDSGTIFDLYCDSSKANGIGNSFNWIGHDGHLYTVRFDMKLQRVGNASSRWGLPNVRIRLLGRGDAITIMVSENLTTLDNKLPITLDNFIMVSENLTVLDNELIVMPDIIITLSENLTVLDNLTLALL